MTIHYVEKGYELHAAVFGAGHWLEQRDGVWVSSDDDAVQGIIDNFDPAPLRRAAATQKVADLRAARQAQGLPYLFSDGQTGTIQTRDVQDLVNINGVATRTLIAPEGAPFFFRDAENRTHVMTREETRVMALAAADYISALYWAKWQHDTAIENWDGTGIYDTAAYWPEV